jgi:hypothetical protein
VNSSANVASRGCHTRPSSAAPYTNTSGGPSPRRSYAISSPFARTTSTVATYTHVGGKWPRYCIAQRDATDRRARDCFKPEALAEIGCFVIEQARAKRLGFVHARGRLNAA